jgi:hypothetical protein
MSLHPRNSGATPSIAHSTLSLSPEGPDAALNILKLMRVISELGFYLQNKLVSDAQILKAVLEQELQPMTQLFEGDWEQFWALDKINLPNFEILGEYTRLKNRVSELKSQGACPEGLWS